MNEVEHTHRFVELRRGDTLVAVRCECGLTAFGFMRELGVVDEGYKKTPSPELEQILGRVANGAIARARGHA